MVVAISQPLNPFLQIVMKAQAFARPRLCFQELHTCNMEENTKKRKVDDGNQKAAAEGQKTKFQSKWKNTYSWIDYDQDSKKMYCKICKEEGLKNAMAVGTDNFKTTTLQRHASSAEHKQAVFAPIGRQRMEKAVRTADSKEELATTACMMAVYWLAKEAVPMNKYSSLMECIKDILKLFGKNDLEILTVRSNVTYTSVVSGYGFLEAISETLDKKVNKQLQESPMITILTDESTDIAVHHKLCISARTINPETMIPSTLFLTDLKIDEATGKAISVEIIKHLEKRGINLQKLAGLGTDGATVMTGRKEGLTGQMLRLNPHLINTHCAAHRIALCSEQAADNIPAMKYYQAILESLFYYFAKSTKRNDAIAEIQKVLEEPSLKYIEVHQVRWLSFYNALSAVYRTLDSLLTYFVQASQKSNDPKASGLKKKMADDFFIKMTYTLMDVLQPVMKLSLFFQRKDVDIALVQTEVNACLSDLQDIRDGNINPDKPTFSKELELHLVNGVFKGNHVISTSKYSFPSTKEKFLNGVIDNITKRFPDGQIMTSFGVLGMRPITMLTQDELVAWGNESMQVLCDHFGRELSHTYKEDGEQKVTTSAPLINPTETLEEWKKVKEVVKVHGYPRHSTADLWNLIVLYHGDMFPNLKILASLALTHPVHTSDCERAFSKQNMIVTPLRNKLSSLHCDQLMRVMMVGPDLKDFDYHECFLLWGKVKSRYIV